MYVVPKRMEQLEKREDLKPGDYAILYFDSISTPGYDRDDPTDTVNVHYLYHTDDRVLWEEEILKMEKAKAEGRYNPRRYVAFHIDKIADVSIRIEIT